MTGKITSDNKPVFKAQVRLFLKSNSLVDGYSYFTKTDLNGNFKFPEVSKLNFFGGYNKYSNTQYGGSTIIYLEEVKIEITFNSNIYIGVIGKGKFIKAYENYSSISFDCNLKNDIRKQNLTESIKYEGICITKSSS